MGEKVGLKVQKVEKVLIEFVFASVLMVVVVVVAESVAEFEAESEAEVEVEVVVAKMEFAMVVEFEVHYCC